MAELLQEQPGANASNSPGASPVSAPTLLCWTMAEMVALATRVIHVSFLSGETSPPGYGRSCGRRGSHWHQGP